MKKPWKKGCNFIITHEPTFYNHLDETGWLADDPVYLYKKDLCEKNNLVIWRCHDYIHNHRPDGIMTGMKKELGWSDYQDPESPALFHIPPVTLKTLAEQLKSTYKVPALRVVGDPNMVCNKIGLMVGSAGGRSQISFAGRTKPDVLICGEINEWETNIYIHDAIHSGQLTALVLLGHCNSEQAGMNTITEWIDEWYPHIPVHPVFDLKPFSYI